MWIPFQSQHEVVGEVAVMAADSQAQWRHLLPCPVSIAPKEMPINWSCDSRVPPPSASQASAALSPVFVLSPFPGLCCRSLVLATLGSRRLEGEALALMGTSLKLSRYNSIVSVWGGAVVKARSEDKPSQS